MSIYDIQNCFKIYYNTEAVSISNYCISEYIVSKAFLTLLDHTIHINVDDSI